MTSLTASTVQIVKTILCCVAIVMMAWATSTAQPVSGYQGKRFIFKVDPVPTIISGTIDTELEAVVGRSFTLGLQPSLYFGKGYFQFGGDDYDSLSETTNAQVMLNFRRYFTGAHVAPVGVYFQFGVGAGIVKNRYQFNSSQSGTENWTDATETVPMVKGRIAWGFQRVLFRRIALDFSGGWSHRVLVQEPRYYGPRRSSLFAALMGIEDDSKVRGGINLSLKLGVLLF